MDNEMETASRATGTGRKGLRCWGSGDPLNAGGLENPKPWVLPPPQ